MKKHNKHFLSVVIPVYNEEKRIQNIPRVVLYLKKQKFFTELIIVNDGSTDKTVSRLKQFLHNGEATIISYKKNRGKGHAIKKGIDAAKGEYIIFLDIDLSTPIEELAKFLEKKDKYHVIIGSRKKRGAKLLAHQPVIREYMGRVFTKLSQVILGIHVSDFTCGFKFFHYDAAVKIFLKSKIDRWGFDSEILFLAKKYGYKIHEVPVEWRHDPHTKVRFPQDIIRSLTELFMIRINNIRGYY